MTIDRLLLRLAAAAKTRAAAALPGRAAMLADRLGTELPEILAEAEPEAVRLSAPGLRARVYGSRKREPDARLAWLAAWLSSGGD